MAKLKMKTCKAAAKRFKRTASGRYKRACAGMNHFTGSKKTKRCRNLRSGSMVSKADQGRLKNLLPG